MNAQESSQRLSRITTRWTLFEQAHCDADNEAASPALRRLMQRYCGAAYRYLLGALRDEDAAMDQFQEFALRFVRGDFRRASADHGRFRDYLKAALRNLVTDYHRQRQAQPVALPDNVADSAINADDDDDFLASWREELLSKTWEALAVSQPTSHAVLLAHVNTPDAPASELAGLLSAELGRPISAGNIRVMLHRARSRFAELLVAEVSHSLEAPTEAQLRIELQLLGLLKYCGPALNQLRS